MNRAPDAEPIPVGSLARWRALAVAAQTESPDWWSAGDIYDDVLEEASCEFVAAMSPDVVLALLDEIEEGRS